MSLESIIRVENELERLLCTIEHEDPRFGSHATAVNSYNLLFHTYQHMLWLEGERDDIIARINGEKTPVEVNPIPTPTQVKDADDPAPAPVEEKTEAPTPAPVEEAPTPAPVEEKVAEPVTTENPKPAPTYDKKEVLDLMKTARRNGINVTAIIKAFGVDNFGDIDAEKYPEVVAALKAEGTV